MLQPTVLLLRPAETAQDDVAVCAAQGWQALVHSPVSLQAEAAAVHALPTAAQSADTVFWVSPGAVGVAASVLPALAHKRHVAVGAATARALQAYGMAQIVCPSDGHDSEAVLRLPLWQNTPQRLLIVRGVGGRDQLAEALRARGWRVAVAEVYRRVPQTVDWTVLQPYVQAGSLKAVYVLASSVAEAWLAQIPPSLRGPLQSLLYLTHHERVAAMLKHHGLQVRVVDALADGLAYLNQTGSRTP